MGWLTATGRPEPATKELSAEISAAAPAEALLSQSERATIPLATRRDQQRTLKTIELVEGAALPLLVVLAAVALGAHLGLATINGANLLGRRCA